MLKPSGEGIFKSIANFVCNVSRVAVFSLTCFFARRRGRKLQSLDDRQEYTGVLLQFWGWRNLQV